jgi:hypothetical protein
MRFNVTPLKPTRAEELESAFAEARENLGACDGVLIIMQKKQEHGGGLLYYNNEDMRLETTVWYLSTLLFRIQCMIAGIKPNAF